MRNCSDVPVFVIVHGAWGGGWEWRSVARALRDRGHGIFTPSLSGVGGRGRRGRSPTRLSTHVDELASLLESEQLRDVVLCGHSYGGMPITGVADRIPHRIRVLVYIDALIPEDGQSALDLLPDEFGDLVRTGLAEHGETWLMPIPSGLLPPAGVIPDRDLAAYVAQLRGPSRRDVCRADPPHRCWGERLSRVPALYA